MTGSWIVDLRKKIKNSEILDKKKNEINNITNNFNFCKKEENIISKNRNVISDKKIRNIRRINPLSRSEIFSDKKSICFYNHDGTNINKLFNKEGSELDICLLKSNISKEYLKDNIKEGINLLKNKYSDDVFYARKIQVNSPSYNKLYDSFDFNNNFSILRNPNFHRKNEKSGTIDASIVNNPTGNSSGLFVLADYSQSFNNKIDQDSNFNNIDENLNNYEDNGKVVKEDKITTKLNIISNLLNYTVEGTNLLDIEYNNAKLLKNKMIYYCPYVPDNKEEVFLKDY